MNKEPNDSAPVEHGVMRQLTAKQILEAVYAYGFYDDDIENIGMDVIVDITKAIEIAHGISGA